MVRTVFVFSGQGSQYYHMGSRLYTADEVYRKWMHRLDTIAADLIGESVLAQVHHPSKNRSDPFDRLLTSHTALKPPHSCR